MLTQKSWTKSATIWSVVISTVGFISDKIIPESSNIANVLTTIVGVGGAISAIYNRVKATAVIKKDPIAVE